MKIEEFWSKVDIKSKHECWPWLGHLTKRGYGHLQIGTKNWKAHRLAYHLAKGELPPELDHNCHDSDCPATPGKFDKECLHRRCCNPDHLSPSTRTDNQKRILAYDSSKTKCPRGHKYDRVDRAGKRRCSICTKVQVAASYQRRKAMRG